MDINGWVVSSAPSVTNMKSIAIPMDEAGYDTGDIIKIRVTYSEAVDVSGTPTLDLAIGSSTVNAQYQSADSTDTQLVFAHTVTASDLDSNGFQVKEHSLDGTIKRDGTQVDADLLHNKLITSLGERVNSGVPLTGIAIISRPISRNNYGPEEDIHIKLTFTAPVTVTGDPEFEFSLGNPGDTRDVRAQYNADLSSGADVVFTYTVLPTDEDNNGIFLYDGATSLKLDTDDSIQGADNRDAVFNFPGLSAQGSHKIDPRPRTTSVEITSTPTAGTDTYGAGEIIEFTLTFNQPLIVTGEPHYVFSLGNSGDTRDLTAAYDAGRSSARALVFTYRVVSTDVDNNGIYLYAGDTSFVLETGETVRNKFGNDARTDYGGGDAHPDHKVDGSQTPANTPPGGLPTISGTAEVGQTLTASTTGITDADGLTTPGWTYQWIHVDTEGTETDIPSATSQTYTLVSGDEVLQFRVRVSFTDDGPATETLRSGVYPQTRGPNAPATLSLTTNRGDVTLDWTPPTDTGSSAITRYQYRVSDDGGNTWSPDFTDVPDQNSDSDQADERSYTISSLTLGTEHTIEVRAHNAGAPGASASRTVTPATTPGRPRNVNATAGDEQVALTWSAPSSDGGSPITHYQYRVRDDTDGVWLPGFTNGFATVPDSDADMDLSDERSITVTGLTNGHEYKFYVRAHNDQGGSGVAGCHNGPVRSPGTDRAPGRHRQRHQHRGKGQGLQHNRPDRGGRRRGHNRRYRRQRQPHRNLRLRRKLARSSSAKRVLHRRRRPRHDGKRHGIRLRSPGRDPPGHGRPDEADRTDRHGERRGDHTHLQRTAAPNLHPSEDGVPGERGWRPGSAGHFQSRDNQRQRGDHHPGRSRQLHRHRDTGLHGAHGHWRKTDPGPVPKPRRRLHRPGSYRHHISDH